MRSIRRGCSREGAGGIPLHAARSRLWIFVMFNFTYADILTLYFNNVLQKQAWQLFQSGTVGSVHITQGFVLLGAVLLETAIAMVLLSRVLKFGERRGCCSDGSC